MNGAANAHAVVMPAHYLYPLMWTVSGWPYLLFAFLVGSIPFGVIVSRAFFKTDIRSGGSGNIGAANALRTLGTKAGAAVLLLDAFKGVAAVLVAWHLWLRIPLSISAAGAAIVIDPGSGPIWALVPLAGFAAILGHCYSPWLNFKGGKGVATFLGATFALSWESGLAFVIVWLAIVLPTGFASLGSLFAALTAGIVLVVTAGSYGDSAFVFALGSVVTIVWKHRENLVRLRCGTESRLTLLKR